jgi:hypothetical protein
MVTQPHFSTPGMSTYAMAVPMEYSRRKGPAQYCFITLTSANANRMPAEMASSKARAHAAKHGHVRRWRRQIATQRHIVAGLERYWGQPRTAELECQETACEVYKDVHTAPAKRHQRWRAAMLQAETRRHLAALTDTQALPKSIVSSLDPFFQLATPLSDDDLKLMHICKFESLLRRSASHTSDRYRQGT